MKGAGIKKSRVGALVGGGLAVVLAGWVAQYVLTGRFARWEASRMNDERLQAAFSSGRANFEQSLEWGSRLERQGRFPDAAAAYGQAAEKDATRREPWKGWARVTFAAGDWKTADQVLRKIVELWPEDAETRFLWAAELNNTFRLTAAREQLQEGLRRQPNAAAAWRSLGDADMRLEKYSEAVEALRKAKKLDPKGAELTGLLGWAQLRAGFNDEALQNLRAAVQENPANFDWRFYMAQALAKTGKDADRNEAVQQCNRVTAFSDRKSRGYVEVARIWIGLGNDSDAVRFLEQALLVNKNDTDALSLMVDVQKHQNHEVEAAAYERRLAPLQKREDERKAALARVDANQDLLTLDGDLVRLGQADLRLGRAFEARLAFQAALCLSPKNADAAKGMKAVAQLEKALAPGSADAPQSPAPQ